MLPRLIEAQRGRWALWLAPLVVSGILLYFALPAEPPGWLGPAMLAVCVAGRLWLRAVWPLAPAWVAVAALAAGFSAAQLRAAGTGTPILDGRLGPATVQGRIVEIAPLPGEGGRVLLEELSIQRLTPEETPRRVRIRIAAPLGEVAPGDRITVISRPQSFSVLGAPNRAEQIRFPRGRVSLSEAVALAGGNSAS